MSADDDPLKDLEALLRGRVSVVCLDTVEEERAATLLRYLADKLKLPLFLWSSTKGLRRDGLESKIYGSTDAGLALDHIESADLRGLYFFHGLGEQLDKPAVRQKVKDAGERCAQNGSTVIFTPAESELPAAIERLSTRVSLALPSDREFGALVKQLLRDLSLRMPLTVRMSEEEARLLLGALKGLTLMEAQKILTKVIVVDQALSREDISRVLEIKREIVERDGVLEYFPHEAALADVAGLAGLKDWLRKRKEILLKPEQAAAFGLEFPKGILLLGVQGCGKSLCAKVVAREWGMPLLKLDPSNLYNKYVGESEKNLKKAIRTAEAMAPVVLWIDEIEKAFSFSGADDDGGLSRRMFGSLLSWLQEKKQAVFVIATANDIETLPPELVRKGRFDEIFFVDLPDAATRAEIFRVHLAKKRQRLEDFDLNALAAAAEGFTGAEIEQAVVSGLYSVFSGAGKLTTAALLTELGRTAPLSRTMSERVERLRRWAEGRAVPAG